jgi:Uma2 family endonuclease
MNVLTKPRMTVDEFLAWASTQPGRYELHKGQIFSMSPETIGHLEAKVAVHDALRAAIRSREIPCHVLPDGATVRVDTSTAYEPDALVYCGAKLPASAIEVSNPVVIVEVLSPTTAKIDTTLKLVGYFRLPSVRHYLIVDPTQLSITHHARGPDDTITTRIISEGTITLDPPGLALAVSDIYSG